MASKKNKNAKGKDDSSKTESKPIDSKVENTTPKKEDGDKKSSRMPLILGGIFLILLLLLAGTGIFLGLKSLSNDKDNDSDEETVAEDQAQDESSDVTDSAIDNVTSNDVTTNDSNNEEANNSDTTGSVSSDATESVDSSEDSASNEDSNNNNNNNAAANSETEKANTVDTASVAVPAQSTSSHTVVGGDTLWQIAERTYGNGFDWVKILNANSGNIGFLPNGEQALIIPGQVLVIP